MITNDINTMSRILILMPIFRGKAFVSSQSRSKDSVRLATTSNINLGAIIVSTDGVNVLSNDRILLAGQTTASQNGIYVVNAETGILRRATDTDTGAELLNGLNVWVEEGNQHAKSTWVLITYGVITLGSTDLIFVKENQIGQFESPGTYGSNSKSVTITVDESGEITEISEQSIDIDGGEF